MENNKEKITILGAGAFGTAMATLLANNGYQVSLWCHEEKTKDEIKKYKENKSYLPGISLDSNIDPTNFLETSLKDTDWIFEAVPVKFIRNILNQAKNFIVKNQILVILSKGIEQETLLLPTQIATHVLGEKQKTAVMAGPNFAKELAQKLLTATDIASDDSHTLIKLSKLLSNNYFKVESSQDPIGVQIGGALKNLITLFIGVAQGHGFGENTISYISTIGFKEISKLSEYLGGKKETVYGLSGFGDFFLTSTGSLSRNLEIGKKIGALQLEKKFDWKKHISNQTLPEGINTTQSVYQIIKKHGLNLPLCLNTYEIIFNQKSIKEVLKEIF